MGQVVFFPSILSSFPLGTLGVHDLMSAFSHHDGVHIVTAEHCNGAGDARDLLRI